MATVECSSCRTTNPSEALYCSTCGAPTHHSDGDELIGTTVGGRYHLVEKIGQGSAGTLYRAEHVTLRRRMAVKLLHKQLALSDEAIERFRREAITVCEIDNDHIPQVHDFGRTEDDRLFFAMEYLDGETLSSVLEREGRLSPERTADILTQMADGLMEAHTLGYVHRDLRPRSIFLTRRRGRQDFVKILDFGLAKLVQPEVDAQRTTMGMTYGDPRYMAPEQARGEVVDRRGDIYSLGALGFEMLVGEPPFKGGGTFEVLQKVLDAPVPRVRERRSDCPPWLESIVRTALAKRPGDRFQTVAQLLDALGRKQVLASQPPMPMQLTNQQASKLAGSRDAPSVPGRPVMQVFVSSPSLPLRPIPVADDSPAPANPTQVMPTVAPGNRGIAPGPSAAKPAPAAPAQPVAPRTTLSYPTVKSTRSGTVPGMKDAKAGTETGGGPADPKGSTSGELQLLGSRLPPVEPKSVPPVRAEPAAKASLLVAPTTPPRNDPTPRTARAMLEQEAMAWEEAALPVMGATDLTESASLSEPAGRAPSADTPVEEMKFGAGAPSAASPPPAAAAPRPISAPAIAAMRSLHPSPVGPKASEPTKAVPTPAPASTSAPTKTAAAAASTKASPATDSSASAAPRTTDSLGVSKTSDRSAATKPAPSPSRPGEIAAAKSATAQPKSSDGRADSTVAKSAAAKTSESRTDAGAGAAASSQSKPGDSRADSAVSKPGLSAGRTAGSRSDGAGRSSAMNSLEGRETVPFERVAAPTASALGTAKPGTDKTAAGASAAGAAAAGFAGPGLLGGDDEVEGADTGDATIPTIRMPGRDDETPIIGHNTESARSPAAAAAGTPPGDITEPSPVAAPDAPSRDTPPDARARPSGAESNWFSTPATSAADGFAADDGDVAIGRRGLPKWALPAAAAAVVVLVIVFVATRPSPPRPSPTPPPAAGTSDTPATTPPAPAATGTPAETAPPPATPPSSEAAKPDSPATAPGAETSPAAKPGPEAASATKPGPEAAPAAKGAEAAPAAKPGPEAAPTAKGPEVTPLPVATAIPSPASATDAPAPKGPEARPSSEKPVATETKSTEKPPAKTPAKAAEREPRAGSPEAKGKTKASAAAKEAAKTDEPVRKEAAAGKGDAEPGAAKAEKGEKKPGDAVALVQNGRKKLDDGEPEAAAALFARAVELDPRNAEAVGGLGESSFEQGNFDAAARHLSKAAKLAPKRNSYQELLVQALYKAGRYKDCVEACRKLLKQAPASAKAKQTLELAEKKLAPE